MFVPVWVFSVIGMFLAALVAYIFILRMQRSETIETANEITIKLRNPIMAEVPVQQFRLLYDSEKLASKIVRRGY